MLELGFQRMRLYQPHEFGAQLAGWATLQLHRAMASAQGRESVVDWCAAAVTRTLHAPPDICTASRLLCITAARQPSRVLGPTSDHAHPNANSNPSRHHEGQADACQNRSAPEPWRTPYKAPPCPHQSGIMALTPQPQPSASAGCAS